MDILRSAGAPVGGITRALRILTVAVIVVPVVLFAAAAWVNYVSAFRDARERVDRAKDAIHEYALKAFESDELILDRVAEHIAGKDPSELIGSEEFHRYPAVRGQAADFRCRADYSRSGPSSEQSRLSAPHQQHRATQLCSGGPGRKGADLHWNRCAGYLYSSPAI